MKLFPTASITTALACAMLVAAPSASAEPLHKSYHRHAVVHNHRVASRVVVTRPAPIRTVSTVSAVGLSSLPVGYVRFLHGDETFYYREGIYYEKKPHGFVIVKPRAGFRVASLPRGYRIVREGGSMFYSYNNVRYRKLGGFFVVV